MKYVAMFAAGFTTRTRPEPNGRIFPRISHVSSAALAKRISAPPNKAFITRENDRRNAPAVIFLCE